MSAQRIVVVAEDDDELRELLIIALSADDRRVLGMEDGSELLDYMEFIVARGVGQELPDLILTDNHMPGANGVDVAKWSRAHGVTCPFVILTGFVEEALAAEVLGDTVVLDKSEPLERIQHATDVALSRVTRST